MSLDELTARFRAKKPALLKKLLKRVDVDKVTVFLSTAPRNLNLLQDGKLNGAEWLTLLSEMTKVSQSVTLFISQGGILH